LRTVKPSSGFESHQQDAPHTIYPESIGLHPQVTLLFTDLRGSTALYERAGDVGAYRLVRRNFAFLAGVIRERNGTIVKTIGDPLMAAFIDPADGVNAALEVQRTVAAFNDAVDGEDLVIKLGVHCGSCIAVTLNGRLDYFGSTIDMAARLQGDSEGEDIVFSEEIAGDPVVAEILAAYSLARENRELKGFDEPIQFLRLPPAAMQASA